MTVAARLKSLRKAAGMTQAEFAKRIGIAQGSLSLIESGDTRTLRAQTLLSVAKALNVDPRWLYTGRGAPFRDAPDDDEAEVLALYEALTPDHRKAWLAAGKGLLASQPPSAGNPFPQVPAVAPAKPR